MDFTNGKIQHMEDGGLIGQFFNKIGEVITVSAKNIKELFQRAQNCNDDKSIDNNIN